MKYYKIVYGYNEGDSVAIDETELAKAIAVFMQGGKALFRNGAVRGQDIMRIIPDWHADQGWNKGWKMTPEDFSAVKHLEAPYQNTYEKAKLIAEMAIKENKPELLTTPVEQISLPPGSFSEETKKLADKFKM